MRKHLQPLLIAYEILKMIQNEDAYALFGISDILEPGFELFENGGEGVLLNQEQQALFGFAVVIKPRQRHSGGARKIAHGGAFVSLATKDLGGMVENVLEAAIKAGPRNARGRSAGISTLTARGAGCG
jgi:hypothetical protein